MAKKTKCLLLILRIIIYTVVAFLIISAPILVYLNLDPIGHLFCIPNNFALYILLMIIRILSVYNFANEVVKLIFTFLIISMILCNCFKKVLTVLHLKHGLKSKYLLFNLYQKLQISIVHINHDFCSPILPPLILFGEIAIIFSSYCTIRLINKINWVIYLYFPCTSILGLFFFLIILPLAANIYERSDKYLLAFGGTIRVKYHRKVYKSLKPIFLCVGPYAKIRRRLQTVIYKNIIEYTIDALLSF